MPTPENQSPLSDREQEILQLLVTGATNLQIAGRLTISPNTVKVHLRNIYEKIGVQSRTEASMLAVREGWVTLEGAAQPALSVSAAPKAQPVPTPLWQRIYLVAALLLVLLAFFYVQFMSGHQTPSQTNDLSDPQVLADVAGMARSVAQWVMRAPMPTARSRLALVAYEDKLYAIGGASASGVTGLVEVYDPESNGWLPLASKPTGVSNAGAAVVDGMIYVPGGYTVDGTPTDVLEVYDTRQDTWTSRSPLPQPLCAYAMAATPGRIYLIGGWDGSGYVASVYIYDPQEDRWLTGVPMDEPRGFAAAIALDDTILVAGGYDGTKEFAQMYAYHPAAQERGADPWTRRADMASPRGGLGIASTGDALYAIGGGWTASADFSERYDPSTDTWSSIPMPLASHWRNMGVTALGGRVFAVGGWSGGHLALNEEYRTLLYFLPLGAKSDAE
jgi:DNA-binding CsgD family transcriptional regulator